MQPDLGHHRLDLGLELLAIPQLALDQPGQEPNMNGGSSDADLLLFRRSDRRFLPWSTLPAPGGEDAEFFTIGDRSFLAVASLRCGSGPYDFATNSQIFVWSDGRFIPYQAVPTFAAKQWKHWRIGARHFLGLAQGVEPPGVVVNNLDGKPTILKNDGASHNNWITIKLVASGKNRDAIGARVKVVSGELTQWDEIHAGGSYLSSNDPRLHYGLQKKTKVDLIEVHWPDGKLESAANVPANNFLVIEEGKGLTRTTPPSVKK